MSQFLDFYAFLGRVRLQRIRTCGPGKRTVESVELLDLEAAVTLRDALDSAIQIAAKQRADEDRHAIEIHGLRLAAAQARLQVDAEVAQRFAAM